MKPIPVEEKLVLDTDLNGDGKPDFVVTNRGSAKVSQPALMQVFLNTSP